MSIKSEFKLVHMCISVYESCKFVRVHKLILLVAVKNKLFLQFIFNCYMENTFSSTHLFFTFMRPPPHILIIFYSVKYNNDNIKK